MPTASSSWSPGCSHHHHSQAGNLVGSAQLVRSGAMPFPYLDAASASANVVDRGANVGLAFSGSAPDIGASEYGLSAGTIGLK